MKGFKIENYIENYVRAVDKHIAERTYPVDARDVVSAKYRKDNGSIEVVYQIDGLKWTGALQGVELDRGGETTGYWVYPY